FNHQRGNRLRNLQIMKLLIDSMAFSHRPSDGISVGIAVIAGVAYMSASFVRDGDYFNRKLARQILAQRIVSTIEDGKDVKFVTAVENVGDKLDARTVVREFRKLFKPDPTCNDLTFHHDANPVGGVKAHFQMSRKEQW